jgi:hypothetical protein
MYEGIDIGWSDLVGARCNGRRSQVCRWLGRDGKANPGQSSQNRASVRLSVRTIGIESSPPIGVCKAVALGTESHNALHRFTLNSCEIMIPSRSQRAENIVQKKQSFIDESVSVHG